MDIRGDGVVRLIALVALSPRPTSKSTSEALSRDSFGSFNVVYRVRSTTDKFGEWTQLRFERNPLLGGSMYPRWFGLGLGELPRELGLLRAMGQYQHQQRQLDDAWFHDLLIQLL
jgi:hypothetical protein